MSAASGKSHTAPPEESLESALKKLEEILGRMENGELPLERLITEFETGADLVRFCREKLDAAGRRIETVIQKLDGSEEIEAVEEADF